MGNVSEHAPLSGVWSGQYWRDQDGCAGVKFSAWLNVSAGRLSGSTLEPHIQSGNEGEEVDAVFRGHITDNAIELIKTYQGLEMDPIYCDAKIIDNGQRIVGHWYYGWPDEVTGRFELNRDAGENLAADKGSAAKPA